MAGKPQNRLELRRQHEAAEDLDPIEDEADVAEDVEDEEEGERKPKKKKAGQGQGEGKPKSTKAAKPAARTRIVWNVVNDAFKTVATFAYTEKAEAEAKAEELNAKGKGTFFVQKAKEPMPDDAPGLGATIVRTPPAPAAAVVVEDDNDTNDVSPPEDDSEDDDDDEDDDDSDDDSDDD